MNRTFVESPAMLQALYVSLIVKIIVKKALHRALTEQLARMEYELAKDN